MNINALLDPEFAEGLKGMPRLASFSFDQLPRMRKERLAQLSAVVLSDRVERRDYEVPGPPGAPNIKLRVHRLVEATKACPCLYWIHGGGYVMGSYEVDDLRFDKWCQALGCVGVSVEYRLAPETPYPGAIEDCYAGLSWVRENAVVLGVDATRIGIGGNSAGGGLAAGLALLARDRAAIPLAFQLLAYPMIDDRMTTPSSTWDVPTWPPAANERGWAAYLGDLVGGEVPIYAAPARAKDLAGLPRALIVVGTLDGFLDEDVDYALRLMHAGVPTELHVYPGGPHGFDALLPRTALARRARKAMEEWLARALA